MGCLTHIDLAQANKLIAHTSIILTNLLETSNGITDSTYIGTDKTQQRYILKIYEQCSVSEVQNEIDILNHLKSIGVPRVLSEYITLYKHKPVVLYSFIEGKIPKTISKIHLECIASFLSQIHSTHYKSDAKNIYNKSYLETMLNQTNQNRTEFNKLYSQIKDIELYDDALIHGDLFPDNAKFMNGHLSGVYDFGQSCYGNHLFDMAVVIVSWCFEGFEFNTSFAKHFLRQYNTHRQTHYTLETIKPYLLYASLYYALQRYTRVNNVKDYKEYLKKFAILQKVIT